MKHGYNIRSLLASSLVITSLVACSGLPDQTQKFDQYIDPEITGKERSVMRELMAAIPEQYLNEPIVYVTADGKAHSNRTDVEELVTYERDPMTGKFVDEKGNSIVPSSSAPSDELSAQNLSDSAITSCSLLDGAYRRMYTKIGGKSGPYGMPDGEYLAYHKAIFGLRGPESIRVDSDRETAYAFIGGNGRIAPNGSALDAGFLWNPGTSTGFNRGWALFMQHNGDDTQSLQVRWPGNQDFTAELFVLADRPDHIMLRGVADISGEPQPRSLVIDGITNDRFSNSVTDWGSGGYLINFKQTVSLTGPLTTDSYFRGTTITGTRIGRNSSTSHLLRSEDVASVCESPDSKISVIGGAISINK